MPCGLARIGTDGAILDANAEACRILGYKHDELTEKYTREFDTVTLHDDGSPCPEEDYPAVRAIVTGKPQPSVVIGVGRPEADTCWATFTAVPIFEDGVVVEAIVTFVDITEVRRMQNAFRQGQKMEAVGRLAGGVAHDFNNLLTVILGNVEALGETLSEGDERLHGVDDISRAARHAGALTRQLLEFARRRPHAPEVVYAEDVVDDIATILPRLLGERVHTQVEHHAADRTPIEIDPDQFRRVLINLGVNARDAMPQGGNLWIRTGRKETESGPRLSVSVRDEGEGIAAGDIERIFEPFFSTKNEHGTGLGLATVYGAVTQAGGTISVSNAEPQGALFEMSFPISSSVPKDATETPPEKSPSPAVVLVVEDEPLVRRTTARVLESAGYEVIAATSGEEALRLADTQRFDLVLSDVVMPGISGVELSKRLRDINPKLPVVLMSGYSEDLDAFNGARFIAKPFDTRGLRRIVREALNPDD